MTAYNSDYKTTQIPLRNVPASQLADFTRLVLRATDLAPGDADIIADALVNSELCNLQGQGQGVRRVRAYVDRLQQRMVDPNAPCTGVKESPEFALVDSHNGTSTVVAGMHISKAMVCGVDMAVVRHHSTNYGPATRPASQPLALSRHLNTV